MFEDLTIQQKVGQLFFIGIAGTTVDDKAQALLDKINPGGICLFARNIKEARQTRELVDALRRRSKIELFLSLDQEGGLVDRLRRIITPMPAANLIPDSQTAGRFGAIVAEIVRILGLNMDFAPVVDVIDEKRETSNNGMFSRAFGRSAVETAELAGAFLSELQKGGCLGCVKHFPGLGATQVDSHEELPTVNVDERELRSIDLAPYARLIADGVVHSVMVAHAAYPNTGLQEQTADGKLLPSSLSKRVITGLLREELGFDGLVITDDLEMGAIVKNFGVGEACVMAVEAGADMLAICADEDRIVEGFESVLRAVESGRIDETMVSDSLTRIHAAKALLREPVDFDTVRLAQLSDSIGRLKNEAGASRA